MIDPVGTEPAAGVVVRISNDNTAFSCTYSAEE
jgi:hypothetical protein